MISFSISYSLLAQSPKRISIRNTTDLHRQELLSIPYQEFQKQFGLADSIFTVVHYKNRQPLNYQLETCGEKVPQNILIALDIRAHETIELVVERQKPSLQAPKAFARYVPERKDDFAWENDLVAYRAYGKALEGTNEDAQGFDFWAKRTSRLIINEWYKNNNYHTDQGSGLDYYSVGQSLGVGDIALYYADQIQYTKHYRSYEIVDNGPLRTTFKLFFAPELVAGRTVSLVKTISLDAGSQLNKISVTISSSDRSNIPIVLGIARRNEEEPAYNWDEQSAVFSYWEPAYKDNKTGTGLIMPRKPAAFILDKNQFLFKMEVLSSETLSYYSGAAFNKAGKIQDAASWRNYLRQRKEQLNNPLRIEYLN